MSLTNIRRLFRGKFNKSVDEFPWGTRVRDAGTMNRISVDNVFQRLVQLMNEPEKVC